MSSIPANHVLGLEFNWHGKKGECINLPSALYTYLSAGSRLCDKGGGGPRSSRPLEIGGGCGLQKVFFGPSGLSFVQLDPPLDFVCPCLHLTFFVLHVSHSGTIPVDHNIFIFAVLIFKCHCIGNQHVLFCC